MRSSDDWVEQVRAHSDIAEVIGERVALKRVGRNWMGLCPFHKEKTPSFSVNAERQFYHCFSCKAGGDVFKFVQELDRLEFLEAAEMLSRRAGIPIPERRSAARGVRAPLLEALEAAAAAYEQWLGDPEQGRLARAILERRGISRETAKRFRLGIAPAGWENLTRRLRDRFGEDVLVDARLASRRDASSGRGAGIFDWFRNRLMVPLIASGGTVVGFGARAIAEGDEPKYLNSPESAVYHKGSFLFALDQARRNVPVDGELIVVEGYFDAIALHQAGLANTVATSGTALTEDQARQIKRLVPRVALTYDGDRAGRDAMMRSLGILLAEGLDVAIVDLPDGEDPDTLVRQGGAEAWVVLRRTAADPAEFVQRHVLRAKSGGDEGAPAGDPREAAAQAMVRLLSGVKDPVRFRLMTERGSQVLGLSEAVLTRAAQLQRGGASVEHPVGAAVRAQRRHEESLERRLLQALLLAPSELEPAREKLSSEEFRDPASAMLARALWSGAELEGDAASLARELMAAAPELDWSAEARGAVRLLQVRRLEVRHRELTQMLRKPLPPDEEARLAHEVIDLQQSLRNLKT
ncbi:MAG TPA: DNA primase [Candidatus Udaeobacter sp.]|jgi:DNA primase|nr:DNA primase [Candidatus Udaeobacter sp.]